jgi:hypothetical protein
MRTESSVVNVLVICPLQIQTEVIPIMYPCHIRVGWAGGCEYPKLEEERLEADRVRAGRASINRERKTGILKSERILGIYK